MEQPEEQAAQRLPAGIERRARPRAQLKTEIHLRSESNFFTGLTRDISEGGVFIATYCPVPVGTIVELEFTLPPSWVPVRVTGEVRWIAEYNPSADGHPGLGMRFIDLGEADRQRIERFVRLRETMFYEE